MFNLLKNRIFWPNSTRADGLLYWRERIIFGITVSAIIVGIFAYIPSIYLSIKEDRFDVAALDTIIYAWFLYLNFNKNLPINVRSMHLLAILYVLGAGLIALLGPMGAGNIWLFGFAVLAGLLLGTRGAFAALVINAGTMVVIGCLVHYGIVGWLDEVPNNLEKWTVVAVNFLLLNAVVSISQSLLLKGLEDAFDRQRGLTEKLEIEQDALISAHYSLKRLAAEQRASGEKLRQSEEKFRRLVEDANAVIYTLDENGLITYASPMIETILNYKPEDVVGRPFTLFFHDDDVGAVKKRFVKALNRYTGPAEYRMLTKDGNIRWINAHSRFMAEDERGAGLKGVLIDITDRKIAEEALKRSEEQYRGLFNSISDYIFTIDYNGFILQANPAMNQAFDGSSNGLIGRNLYDFVPGKNRAEANRKQLILMREGSLRDVIAIRTNSEEDRYIDFYARVVAGDDGEKEITGIGRDITEKIWARRELKKMENQLRQSQKMQAVGTLASGIAHDFNNILQAICGYVQLGRKKGFVEPRHLDGMDHAARQGVDLVRQLLTLSRKADPVLKSLDLNDVVNMAAAILMRTLPKMIEIKMELASESRRIAGDSLQLEQIIMNLGTNARDAMPDGGRLTIKTDYVKELKGKTTAAGVMPPGEYMLLEVGDDGTGMDEDVQEHMFEPFFTSKEIGQGTGLGLSTVYGIVKGHKGYIDVDSKPGEGAVFRLFFPIDGRLQDHAGEDAENEMSEAYDTGAVASVEFRKEKILLVDDDPSIRDIACEFLTDAGFEIVEAESGERALEVYSNYSDEIKLVILDLGMPGMGGANCLKELLALNPGLKILVASGYSSESLINRDVKGYGDFIAKPYDLDELIKKVDDLIKSADTFISPH